MVKKKKVKVEIEEEPQDTQVRIDQLENIR